MAIPARDTLVGRFLYHCSECGKDYLESTNNFEVCSTCNWAGGYKLVRELGPCEEVPKGTLDPDTGEEVIPMTPGPGTGGSHPHPSPKPTPVGKPSGSQG